MVITRESGPAISLTNLTKFYRTDTKVASSLQVRRLLKTLIGGGPARTKALDNVTFDVPAGSVFGLLGPNGAGKTTLVKILSTLVLPDSGMARVRGIDVTKHPHKTLRHLQTVLSEGFGFERRLTGRQNLEFYSALYGLRGERATKRIEKVLRTVGLQGNDHLKYQRYSTGMARRLLVSRSLLSEASILVFDEPTSGMDPANAIDFRKVMTERLAHKEGRTIVLTTHNMLEAEQVCDLIGVLDKGKLVALGSPDEIRKMVGEKHTLSLTLGGERITHDSTAPQIIQQLAKVVGVESVSMDGNGSIDSRAIQIFGYKELDYSSIFELLVKEHVKIVSIESNRPSLEDAFVFLTGKKKE